VEETRIFLEKGGERDNPAPPKKNALGGGAQKVPAKDSGLFFRKEGSKTSEKKRGVKPKLV